ncbi:hypothetical protein [Streptomyces sp. MI02-7b]|uniref:hypothetical protein n=1 Tax=Streptomyces sp. MI02-7b TaxID=462941 RepID=UPI0029BD05B7|nr:hypothetical protein [Streptomyces sp. MI02-7b]MDX3071131.1 hypothetical protein [Streptomyces sp. MI02-7b]
MAASLRLFADHCRIDLCDDSSEGDLSRAWTARATADHVAVTEDALGIGTVVNLCVAVDIEILLQPPSDDSPRFDHVAEAGVHVPSGSLVVLGCGDYGPGAARFAVAPGWNRVRVSKRDMALASRAHAGSQEDSDDMDAAERIRVQQLPGPRTPTRVIKRWNRSGAASPPQVGTARTART